MSLFVGSGWAALRTGLAATGLVAASGSLAAALLAIWGVRSARIGWSFAMETLLGTATPALAVVALASGLAAGVLAFAVAPKGGLVAAVLASLLGAGVLVALGGWRAQQAREALSTPPVHDVATDWREPLMPSAALVRRRGADALPIEAAPALSEGPRTGFLGRLVAEVNAATCPQARPLVLQVPPAAAYVRVKAALLKAGLRLVTDDPGAGVLEAEAPAPLAYGGRADVLARLRPRGEAAVLDLRSVSRHGSVDGGGNCRRVTTLLAAIASS